MGHLHMRILSQIPTFLIPWSPQTNPPGTHHVFCWCLGHRCWFPAAVAAAGHRMRTLLLLGWAAEDSQQRLGGQTQTRCHLLRYLSPGEHAVLAGNSGTHREKIIKKQNKKIPNMPTPTKQIRYGVNLDLQLVRKNTLKNFMLQCNCTTGPADLEGDGEFSEVFSEWHSQACP